MAEHEDAQPEGLERATLPESGVRRYVAVIFDRGQRTWSRTQTYELEAAPHHRAYSAPNSYVWVRDQANVSVMHLCEHAQRFVTNYTTEIDWQHHSPLAASPRLLDDERRDVGYHSCPGVGCRPYQEVSCSLER